MTKTKPESTGRKFVKVCNILDQHGRKASRLVPILQAVQEEYRYLPQEVLTYVATALDVSPAKVFNPPKSAKGLTKPAWGTFTMNVSLPGPP